MAMTALERATAALKAEIGRALDAKPLPFAGETGNWSAKGDMQTLDLEVCARAVLMAVRELPDKILNEHLHDNEYGYSMYYEGWQPAIDAILNEKE